MTNWVREAAAGILRCVFAALLLASGSSALLAQPRNPGLAAPGSGEQRFALVIGNSRYKAAPLNAPDAVQTLLPAARQNDLQRLAAGTVFRDCADCPEMVVIPSGTLTFTLGPADGDTGQANGEWPALAVALPEAFGMGKYEVTRAQFARFALESGHAPAGGCFVWNGRNYGQDASRDWRNPGFEQTANDPVVCVNWNDAKAYADWLTNKTGVRYRLPTEVEWEYAARAGRQTPRPWGDNASDACRYANVADASTRRDVPGTAGSWAFHECDDRHAYTAPAGSYLPNAFGLYDMMGNAWEWTEDCPTDEYAGGPSSRREGPLAECSQRVLRGGSWVDNPPLVRYDFRFRIGAEDRDFYIGFRVTRVE